MQCNQSSCCPGYPNCGNQYAYNCNTGPQCFANPMPTFPCGEAQRTNPVVIGEGEVASVILPDGTTQLFFLPLTNWCKPQVFNPNQQSFGNNFQVSCGIWLIRSFSKPTPPFPFCNSNQMCFPTPQGFVGCNVPCYPALKFHNDGWTSTTDLKYFCPGVRCTACTVLPSKCISVQTSLHYNSGVSSKSCEHKPSCCNAKCSYDSVLLHPPKLNDKDVSCDQISCMSIEENRPRKKNGKAKRREKNASSSESSSISACSCCMSLEESTEDEYYCKKNKKATKKPKKFQKNSKPCSCTVKKKSQPCCAKVTKKQNQKKSEPRCANVIKKTNPCCCADIRNKDNFFKDACTELEDSYDLCSFCNQTDDVSKKNENLQCTLKETSASECCESIRGDDCIVIKAIPSSCSNSTVNSALDHKTELWIPKTDRSKRALDMDWCNCAQSNCNGGASCSRARELYH